MEFINYFKALRSSPRPKTQTVALAMAGYVLLFSGIIWGGLSGWMPVLASLAFASGLSVCYWCGSTPNFEKSFPASHNKKLLYRFMSSCVMFLILLAVILAAMLIVTIISVLFVSVANGGFGWITEEEAIGEISGGEESLFGSFGVYSGLFGLAYFITLYSAGMITGFIKKRKTRNIFLICLCAGVLFGWLFMCLPYFVSNGAISGASPFKESCYAAMGVPWLSTVFWMLVAAGSLGASVYLGVKHYNPKKF